MSEQLSIYFNCGQDDNYGFKGTAAFMPEFRKKVGGAGVSSIPRRSRLSYFLAHFDQVMEPGLAASSLDSVNGTRTRPPGSLTSLASNG